jgi:hypothetical protein
MSSQHQHQYQQTGRKSFRTEEELEKMAVSLFQDDAECHVLCDDLQTAEDDLDALMASGNATAQQKARLVARIRAIVTRRKILHCQRPCFFT